MSRPFQKKTTITIKLNESSLEVSTAMTVGKLRAAHKPGADVLIRNGAPCNAADRLQAGDEVVLIRRGEKPSAEQLEALLVARHGPGVHEKVRRAHVGVAGCGGLGSAVAIALARTGVGQLTLVDFDVVEPSNLNRQQFFVDQIGLPKVAALTDNLRRINPYVKVHARQLRLNRENIPDIFSGCLPVAECFDDPAMKRDMTLAMHKRLPDTPLVTVSGIAGYGPANAIGSRRVFGNVFVVGDGESGVRPGLGLLAPRVAVAAGHQANVILRLILGEICDDDEG